MTSSHSVGRVYTLNGTVLPLEYTVNAIAQAAAAAAAAAPLQPPPLPRSPLQTPPAPAPYCGVAPVIACGLRMFDVATIADALTTAAEIAARLPEGSVTGFDLVGQEDPGKPLTAFVETLLEYADLPERRLQYVNQFQDWVSPRICSRTLMGYSRGGSLLPSIYADGRSSDDVIAF